MARRETRFTPFGRSAQTVPASQRLKRALRARGHALCAARRRRCRCRRTPDHGFASSTEVFVDEDLSGAARWAVPGGGDLWGGEKRSDARGSPAPQAADRREAMKRRRVQRRCERHRSRPCGASIAAKSARSADRHSRSHHRVPPAAPLNRHRTSLQLRIGNTGSASRKSRGTMTRMSPLITCVISGCAPVFWPFSKRVGP